MFKKCSTFNSYYSEEIKRRVKREILRLAAMEHVKVWRIGAELEWIELVIEGPPDSPYIGTSNHLSLLAFSQGRNHS